MVVSVVMIVFGVFMVVAVSRMFFGGLYGGGLWFLWLWFLWFLWFRWLLIVNGCFFMVSLWFQCWFLLVSLVSSGGF